MADGVAITAGAGTTIATDDAGASGHVQIVKLALSADGSASPITADSGGLLVNLGTNNDVTVTGSVTADTELPTAAAMADAVANPTVPAVDAKLAAYNGSTWDRLRTVEGVANNASTGIQAAGSGPGFSRVVTGSITANGQSVTINAKGTEQLGVTLAGTWSGTVVVEYTIDDSTWVQDDTGIVASTLLQASGSFTANTTVFVDSSSVSQYRVRSTAWTSGTLNVTMIGSHGTAINYGSIINPRPDRIGAALVHKDVEYTSAQTGTAVWTPASGKKFVVTDFTVTTGGTTSGIVTLWQGSGADTTYSAGTDPAIFRGEFAPSTASKPGFAKTFSVPYISTTADHVLRITTSAAMTVYVQINGYEV
jgi:hypothetical protein